MNNPYQQLNSVTTGSENHIVCDYQVKFQPEIPSLSQDAAVLRLTIKDYLQKKIDGDSFARVIATTLVDHHLNEECSVLAMAIEGLRCDLECKHITAEAFRRNLQMLSDPPVLAWVPPQHISFNPGEHHFGNPS